MLGRQSWRLAADSLYLARYLLIHPDILDVRSCSLRALVCRFMSGWIKWEKDLETDPRFVRLVRQLRNACYASVTYGSNQPVSTALPPALANTLTIGCLTKFWSYADTHIRADDTLDLGADDIDDLVGVPGFAAAMPEDWLRVIDHQHVELPGYQDHNGVAAKKAALAQKRMDRKRTRDRHAHVTQERNGCVTSASLDQTKPDQTRPTEDTAAEPPVHKIAGRVPRETDPDWFLDFKLAYPNRAGDQGWRKAIKAANARIGEGHTPTEFLEGARRYARFCEGSGKLGTEYVKQAATFLGPDKPFLLPWNAPASRGDNRLNANLSAAQEFMRRTDRNERMEAQT